MNRLFAPSSFPSCSLKALSESERRWSRSACLACRKVKRDRRVELAWGEGRDEKGSSEGGW
jgi:hypothetical protein